ncbi:centrosomal protein of 63 kDa isoform X2 [Boleophthalmus pectinirostris]|uniref:centrosomal protein of 63 kDa isoform X2 n=1 Tax=Boleophthalmus pectinirostris TaxID=150288 RepID=UPI0024315EAF|nr:centrosomal protein of 63 kDa isoform X2 [Boleophthalmus pectinirostris]
METLGSQNPDLSLVLSSCEPELQELMRQIDIMISQQRTQWEAEIQTTQVQLKTVQEELCTSRELLQRKELEMSILQKQQESTKTELISKYELQLQKVREELNKLKRSYQKLQRKHVKQDSTGAKDTDSSEVSRLKEKIEEHQRRSADWEQQCVKYQKQLVTLETQNKSLIQEISLLKSQWSLPKEREHKECCSQLQRLRAQLEKAQDSLHSQELELERLRPLEVHAEEREELHATLDSQDSFLRRASLERQRFQNEAERLKQLLQAKDQVIRSLEDCLAAHGGAGVETMRLDLEKTTAKLQCAQTSEAELRAELSCLKEKLEMMSRRKEDQSKTEQELKSIKAEYESCTAEMKKLREELQRAQQTHSGEVEGMRREVSKLTSELHQRDRTISTHSGSLCSIREQLKGEQQRSEQRTTQLKMTQAQLDSLKEENQHLKSLLQCQDSHSPKREDPSLAALRDSYISSLSILEQENLQLRQALGDVQSQLSASSSKSQELHVAAQRDQTDQRKTREPGSGSSHEGEIQQLFSRLQVKPQTSTAPSHSSSQDSRTQSPARSRPSSSNSSELNLGRRNSASSDSAAEGPGSAHSNTRERAIGAESPSGGMVSRFLEEESQRSKELLQILDSHIQNMTENNTRTVSKYLPSAIVTLEPTATNS